MFTIQISLRTFSLPLHRRSTSLDVEIATILLTAVSEIDLMQ